MTPLMFGPASRRLFGLYHPAGEGRPVRGAVLICPPFGQEALRSHRFFKVLADRLARAGFSVLRFDCHGTGDSPGDDEDGDLEGWRRDIGEAHRELIARSGAARVVWFGARIGATLALQAAASASPRIARLVLWEPVLEGRSYLQDLREKHVAELELSHSIPDAGWRRSLRKDPEAFSGEAFGFGISELLRRQVAALTPDSLQLGTGTELVVIAKPDDTTTRQWVTSQTQDRSARHVLLPHTMIWTSNPHPNNEMVPAEALQRVMAEIHE